MLISGADPGFIIQINVRENRMDNRNEQSLETLGTPGTRRRQEKKTHTHNRKLKSCHQNWG
jgi:hypothetical protein